MDYEKKYKEALERAKEIKSKLLLSHLSTESCKAVSEYIDTIIPELAESEDERIRKWLIRTVHLIGVDKDICADQETMDKAIAWLEKQKENPKSADSIPSDCVSEVKCGNSRNKVGSSLEGRKLADEVVAYLIKSGYQPTIKDTLDQKHFQIQIPRHKEDFFHSKEYKHCREILDEYYYEGDFAGDVYTLYVLKQKEQKPAEWSEEDEKKRNALINLLHFLYTQDSAQTLVGIEAGELRNWLKSLRPLPKVDEEEIKKIRSEEYTKGFSDCLLGRQKGWSEGDEELLDSIIKVVCGVGVQPNGLREKQVRFLKSLRPSWKPSEEQMKALETATHIFPKDAKNRKELELLQAQLNKL